MSPIALLLSTSVALAADPFTTSPATPAPQNGITTIRMSANAPEVSTMAVILTCGTEYEAEALELYRSLMPRSDIDTLVTIWEPTANEVRNWFTSTLPAEMGSGRYRLTIVGLACEGEGGDVDEEVLHTRNSEIDGGLPFVDLVIGIRSLTTGAIWLIDASRDGLGVTGDDVVKLGGGDALAISTGPPGTTAGGGLLGAAASVIESAGGGPITLEGLYYLGIKQKLAGTDLNIYTSMGLLPGDEWNGNRARLVLPGGPLIEPAPAPFIPPAIPLTDPNVRKPVPAGCWVAGAGLLTTVVGGGINLGIASSDRSWIAGVNDGTIDATDAELNAGVRHMRTHAVIGGIFTGIGGAALVGGTTWTIIEVRERTVTVTPAGNGVLFTGTF